MEEFWSLHTRRKPGGSEFFSESFKSLVSSMITANPVDRPSLSEIKAHEWYQGNMPTYEEIKEDFDYRKVRNRILNNP